MNGERIEIRYYNPRAGYVTESFTDTNTQAAITSLKARAGNDIVINRVTKFPAPVPPRLPFDRRVGPGR